MKQQITVSVVIPVYNGSRLLQRAVDSTVNQYDGMEVLIVDDASTDNIGQVVKKYANDPNIRYIKNERNMGAAYSRNRGVTLARGEYIAFLDADDWWEPGKIKRQIEIMELTGSVMSYTGRCIFRDGQRLWVYHVPPLIKLEDILKCNYIACSSVLIKREVALEFPMDEGKNIHEDYLTWVRILKKYHYICGIPESYLNYTWDRNSRSGLKWRSVLMRWNTYCSLGLKRKAAVRHMIGYYANWMNGLRKDKNIWIARK